MRSLSSILDQSADRFGACPCVVCLLGTEEDGPCRVLTYDAAVHVMKQHLEWIQNVLWKYADSSNVVVAYLSSNSTDLLLSLLACMTNSSPTASNVLMLPAMLNTRWTSAEMAASLETTPDDISSKTTNKTLLLYDPSFAHSAQETARRLSHSAWAMPLPQFAEAAFQEYHQATTPVLTTIMDDPDLGDRDLWVDEAIRNAIDYDNNGAELKDAVIVFTSGTTSGCKGVRLSHKSLYVQAMAKLRNPCAYSPYTRMLATTVPIFHVGGLSSVLAILLAGGCWVFPSSQAKSLAQQNQFDPSSVIQSLSHPQFPTNTLVVVPAMLTSILSRIDENQTYESVRLILIGGQSASDPMVKHLIKVFPRACIVQTYACTEAASSLTFRTVHPHEAGTTITGSTETAPAGDCVGMPPPHVELCLYHQDESGSTVTAVHKSNQVGVIATRGPHVMNGYWVRGGGKSQRSNPRNDWFITNDLGFMDDKGQLYFCGRVKDVIRTGGETVLSSEVERVLLQHKDIVECAVFALPDEKFGEAVCAALVVRPTTTTRLTLSQVRQFCADHDLAGYKRPRRIFFVKELPRNSFGKLLKYRLVESLRAKQNMQSKL